MYSVRFCAICESHILAIFENNSLRLSWELFYTSIWKICTLSVYCIASRKWSSWLHFRADTYEVCASNEHIISHICKFFILCWSGWNYFFRELFTFSFCSKQLETFACNGTDFKFRNYLHFLHCQTQYLWLFEEIKTGALEKRDHKRQICFRDHSLNTSLSLKDLRQSWID